MKAKKSNKKVSAIVQARINSTRLPGKVLMNLCGKPLLWHIIKRLKQCKKLDEIVIATSFKKADDKIIDFAKKYKIKPFRGSENNVLKRYIEAAENFKAYYIVRVTGDAPLIEPYEIDRLIQGVKNKKADFAIVHPDTPNVHEGFELVSLKALKKTYAALDLKDYHKEHVTIYLKERPDFVKTICWKPKRIFQKSGYRLSVDNMADFKFMQAIYKKFWDGKNIVDLKKVINFLKSKKIAFIIEGGQNLGFGHFRRIIEIAKYLVENKNCDTVFIVNNKILEEEIKRLGFKCFSFLSKSITEVNPKGVYKIIRKENSDAVIIDVNHLHNPSKIIKFLKRKSSKTEVVLIDNSTKARLLVDKNIYPAPEELISNLSWKNYRGKVYAGLKFFPLRQSFIKIKKYKKYKKSIVISMGTSDPNKLTPFIMKALSNTAKTIKVIIGPAFKCKKQIKAIASKHKDIFKLYQSPANYAQIIASSSLVITALGISIYEISYLGVPIIVIGNYKADLKVGEILEKMGYCKYLGYYKNADQNSIYKNTFKILSEKQKKPVIVANKHGVKNISEIILP